MAKAEAQVSLVYRGDAVDDGLMRVEDLAPAMVGTARAFRRAQHVATGGNGPMPEVHVRALRTGSFAVDLVLVEGSIIRDALDLLSGDESTAVVNLGFYVTVALGAIKLIKTGFNRRFRSREESEQNVTITYEDGTSIRVPLASERLSEDPEFTEAARDIVAPMEHEGVSEVEFITADEQLTVTRDERAAFVPTRVVEGVEESFVDMSLSLTTVSFNDGNKWRVNDGSGSFFVDIADDDFAERVRTGAEAFAKGDVIRSRVRIRQWNDGGRLKIERAIVQVLEHRRVQEDQPLPGISE